MCFDRTFLFPSACHVMSRNINKGKFCPKRTYILQCMTFKASQEYDMLKADKETFLLASPAQAVSLAAGLAQRAECRNGPGWPRELGAEMALAGLAMAELGRWCIILQIWGVWGEVGCKFTLVMLQNIEIYSKIPKTLWHDKIVSRPQIFFYSFSKQFPSLVMLV